MPKVSVIIPTWNRGYIIEKTIQSVLSQTMSDLEVLVCDDGSTDNTFEIIEKIKDPRVRLVTGVRGGKPAIPRNNGIRESRGEWLAFLDSDDEWFPEKLERQLCLLDKMGVKAASSNASRFIPERGIIGNYLSLEKEEISFNDLLQVNEIITSSAIIHKSLVNSIIGFPEEDNLKAVEDYAFWLRVATKTNFVYLPEPQLIYRDDAENSVRGTVESNVWKQRKEVFSDYTSWAKECGIDGEFLKKVEEKYKEAVEEIEKTAFDNSIYKKENILLNHCMYSWICKLYNVVVKKYKN